MGNVLRLFSRGEECSEGLLKCGVLTSYLVELPRAHAGCEISIDGFTVCIRAFWLVCSFLRSLCR